MYALTPTITSWPSSFTPEGMLPCVVAKTSVLPLALGLGSWERRRTAPPARGRFGRSRDCPEVVGKADLPDAHPRAIPFLRRGRFEGAKLVSRLIPLTRLNWSNRRMRTRCPVVWEETDGQTVASYPDSVASISA
jgi:hypothetical protein